jgi:hypothetical protein
VASAFDCQGRNPLDRPNPVFPKTKNPDPEKLTAEGPGREEVTPDPKRKGDPAKRLTIVLDEATRKRIEELLRPYRTDTGLPAELLKGGKG